MLSVTPYYIVVVSCPDYMKLDEFQQQVELPISGYVAAMHTSRDSWRGCRQREYFAWTKVTGCPVAGFGAVPNLYRTGKESMPQMMI